MNIHKVKQTCLRLIMTACIFFTLNAAQPVVTKNMRTEYMHNWAGYIATGNVFRSVTAQWAVPALNCHKTPNAFAYQWAGMDSYTNKTLEQAGTGEYCMRGRQAWAFAWYAMLGGTHGKFKSMFTVHTGDIMQSSVTYTGAALYNLTVTDTTTKHAFTTSQHCNAAICQHDSAEIISEGYRLTPWYSGLADYGHTTFIGAGITAMDGTSSGLVNADWALVRLYQRLSLSSRIIAYPTLTLSGSSFTNIWQSEN